MNKYLVVYDCFFATERRVVVDGVASKAEAVKKAIELKRADPDERIEHGGVRFDTFRVAKKLQK